MNFKIVTKLSSFALVIGILSVVLLMAVSVIAAVSVAINEITRLATSGEVVLANLVFVFFFACISGLMSNIYLKYRQRKAFIYIGENYLAVDLADRRDEFFETSSVNP